METLLPRLNQPLDAATYPEFVSPPFAEQLATILASKAPEVFVTLPYRPAYADASGNNGSVHVALIPGEHNLLTEIRRGGITIGLIDCDTIQEVSDVFIEWLRSPLNSRDAVKLWPKARIRADAELFEVDDKIDRYWNSIIHLDGGTDEPFLLEAARIPILRGLLPTSSMSILGFSRCTEYPYTDDCPTTQPLGDGKYRITLIDGSTHDIIGALDAARFVANNLPEGTERAIVGTADDLKSGD
ncbi:DUF6193 family natural product biosynthesis protein [Gimesia aquarii]|uniref:Uncharacterized protein n=1 Tax=Gimesia aquarii TaxID=2527964 RepID=A0A517W3R4_9PLAN|nr:DUF6193 family natural product biosynthesis protein [Gimesia aquarii]QDT99899.1 hypothetical protein V144x_54130 [Gimesia aquarii]